MEVLSGLKTKMEQIKQDMVRVAKEGLNAEFKKFFEEWPEAQAIRWPQYTPYFNDGDPCVFRVGEVTVQLTGAEEDNDSDCGDGFVDAYHFADYKSDENTAEFERMQAIEGAINSCTEVLQALFGDHCKVTVWRDNPEVEVEEYDHD